MKRLIIGLMELMGLMGSAWAQSPFTLDWHGFVNPHYYADSRSVVGGREDMMLFYPKPILRDSLGHDINDGWQANMLAITARLGLTVKGPEMLGANTMAYIEGDFTGSTNATINNLRLRHAYLRLNWDSHELTVGQYWYAMVVHEIMPMTNPLNMGAPFHCYARQPQVRYSYFPTGNWELLAVAQWQLDNMSQGLLNGVPQSSTLFARHSLLYTSLSYSAFGSLTLKGVTFKAQTLLNNSLYEGCSLGGYLMLADSTFQDWHFNTVWLDVERNRGHWRPGLFVGYARNLDYGQHADALHTFGRGHDMEYLWRVQPRLTYKTLKGLDFTAEAEYTRAGYAEAVGNLRLSLSVVYSF